MDIQKLLNKYWLDIAVCMVLLLVVAIGCIYYLRPIAKTGESVRVTIEIVNQNQMGLIRNEAMKEKTVYINSIDIPVSVISVEDKQDKLLITVIGDGSVDEVGIATFLGQRLLIGQKAEIHSGYFAQGKVSNIEKVK